MPRFKKLRPMRYARLASRVHTPAPKPYSVSLAISSFCFIFKRRYRDNRAEDLLEYTHLVSSFPAWLVECSNRCRDHPVAARFHHLLALSHLLDDRFLVAQILSNCSLKLVRPPEYRYLTVTLFNRLSTLSTNLGDELVVYRFMDDHTWWTGTHFPWLKKRQQHTFDTLIHRSSSWLKISGK